MKRQVLKILLTIAFMLLIPVIIAALVGLVILIGYLVLNYTKILLIIIGIVFGIAILVLFGYFCYEAAEEVLNSKEHRVDISEILFKYRGQINKARKHPENKQYQIDVAKTFQELVAAQENELNTKTFICNFNIPCDITISDFSNIEDPMIYIDVNVGKQLYHVNRNDFIIGTKNRVYINSNGSVDKIEINKDTADQIHAFGVFK